MKATAQTFAESPVSERSRFGDLAELFKLRLTILVLLTTLVGFYMGSVGVLDYALMAHALLGTGLLACGAAALNQYLEREHDAKMRRTENRPIPAGRMSLEMALGIGGGLSILGLVYLALLVNPLTSLLGGFTIVTYLFVYTPLKRVTWLNTAVGGVPGALPPLMGWVAAGNDLTAAGWTLFAILFFWQIPHFLAIAWLYREDYERAGFVMLPSIDPEGARTGSQAVSHTLGLVFVSLCPVLFGMAGTVYFLGAFLLGVAFLVCAIRFSRELSLRSARRLFFVSILYLPVLLGMMVLDKVK